MLTLDHVVVGAATLAQGDAWCRSVLGVAPSNGGRHPLMGTHNLLLRLDDAAGEDRYLEILAIDPDAAEPARPRWFEFDRPEVRAVLAEGPGLLAWVARSDVIDSDRETLRAAGVDPGPIVAAERETPDGMLRWRLTIPVDGRRVAHGAVPALIAWEGRRPALGLPRVGVVLERLVVAGVPPSALAMLRSARAVADADGGGAPLSVRLRGHPGVVELAGLSA